jgi:hypothetical protein
MKKGSFIILILTVVLLGCKKSDRDEDKTTNTSEDVAFATNLVYDVFKTIHQAAYSSSGIVTSTTIDTNTVFNCDTITVDTLSNPKKLTIKFNTNCTANGIIRNGSLTASFNGFYNISGTTTSIVFSDFSYNGYTVISGTMSHQYIGLTDSFPTHSISFNELKIQNTLNQKIFYSGNHQLQIIQGKSTPEISDDVYSISGSNTGMAFKGNGFSSQITTNLNLAGNCNWINSGIVTVKADNIPTRTLNFGSGCDNKISVSIYSTNYELVIP